MSSFRQSHTLYRQLGNMVSGDWVKSGETAIPITASIQPATGKDMLNVPEGKRQSAIYAVYTSTAIQTARHATASAAGTQPDQMEIFGHRCEAVHVEPWQNNVINHYRALFARMN
jgi:hypothetical protein